MVKNFIQSVVATGVALYLTPFVVTGFSIDSSIEVLLLGAVVLVLVNFFIKPLVNLISFPINFVTMGFFSFLINALMLYLTSYLVSGIGIEPGDLTINHFGIKLPIIGLDSWYLTLIAAATVISFINWILRKVLL